MNSLTDEELLLSWEVFCKKYEKLGKELRPLLLKLDNLEKEKQVLVQELIKRGVKINEKDS